jgi:ribosomal-protein-alanine N-acetyltransferase
MASRLDPPRLVTARLVLELPEPEEAPRVAAYFRRNKEHLAPWEPPRPAGFTEEPFWRERLAKSRLELLDDQALRFFASKGDEVVGSINFTQIVRGPFQACYLGYSIDEALEGQGYMSEALRAAIPHVFERLRLHRIMANYLPENARSGALLAKLGFVTEGQAKAYLFINGSWRDHVLTSLTNPTPMIP